MNEPFAALYSTPEWSETAQCPPSRNHLLHCPPPRDGARTNSGGPWKHAARNGILQHLVGGAPVNRASQPCCKGERNHHRVPSQQARRRHGCCVTCERPNPSMSPGSRVGSSLLVLVVAGATAANAAIWPMPSVVSSGAIKGIMSPSFQFQCGDDACRGSSVLADAFGRYPGLMFFAGPPIAPSGGASVVSILTVEAGSVVDLTMGVDESYNISIGADGVGVVSAYTHWGALRGVESFSQLVSWAAPGTSAASQAASAWPGEFCAAGGRFL